MKTSAGLFIASAVITLGHAERHIFKISEELTQGDHLESAFGEDKSELLFDEDFGFWDRFLTGAGSYSTSFSFPTKPDAPRPTQPTTRPPPRPTTPRTSSPIAMPVPTGPVPTSVPVAGPTPAPQAQPTPVVPPTTPTTLPPTTLPTTPTTLPTAPPTVVTTVPTTPPPTTTSPASPPPVSVAPTTPPPAVTTAPVSVAPTTPPPAVTTAPATPPPATAAPVTVVPTSTLGDLVRNGEDFTTLENLLDNLGLLDFFDTPGLDYTVFAPTDEAFVALDPVLLGRLANTDEWRGHTTCVLTYHVVDGIVRSTDLSVGQTLETLEGSNVTVTSLNPPTINDSEIIVADVEASNGIAHVLGEVLTPACVTQSFAEYLEAAGDFTILLELLTTSGVGATIDSFDFPVTLFAPPDSAFEGLDLAEIISDEDLVIIILANHAFEGNLYSNLLKGVDLEQLDNLGGATAFFSDTGTGITINDVSTVDLDILRSNGVIHTVEQVVQPLFTDQFLRQASTLSKGTVSYGSFAEYLDSAGLLELVAYVNPLATDTVFLTMFAPSDEVFDGLNETFKARFADPVWFYHNQAVWLRHLSTDSPQANTEDLVDAGSIVMANGNVMTISADLVVTDSDSFISAQIDPELSDLFAVNGAIHTVDDILYPAIQLFTIVELAQFNTDVLGTFLSLLAQTGLEGALSGDGPVTVFAPTNAAFEAIGISPDTTIPDDQLEAVTDVLLYHVLEGNGVFTEWAEGEELESLQGGVVVFTSTTTPEPRYFINGEQILSFDLPGNGILYTIAGVLTPPAA